MVCSAEQEALNTVHFKKLIPGVRLVTVVLNNVGVVMEAPTGAVNVQIP